MAVIVAFVAGAGFLLLAARPAWLDRLLRRSFDRTHDRLAAGEKSPVIRLGDDVERLLRFIRVGGFVVGVSLLVLGVAMLLSGDY